MCSIKVIIKLLNTKRKTIFRFFFVFCCRKMFRRKLARKVFLPIMDVSECLHYSLKDFLAGFCLSVFLFWSATECRVRRKRERGRERTINVSMFSLKRHLSRLAGILGSHEFSSQNTITYGYATDKNNSKLIFEKRNYNTVWFYEYLTLNQYDFKPINDCKSITFNLRTLLMSLCNNFQPRILNKQNYLALFS